MTEKLQREIIAEIEAAFDGVKRGAITLHEADVIDRYGSDSDRTTARARDTERRWQDVPGADIETHPSILSYLCPESFRYYLPAFMTWTLCNFLTSGSCSWDFTIYALTPNTNKPFDRWKIQRFQIFSLPQKRAIRRFLEFMAEHSEERVDTVQARLALEAYWINAAGNE